MWIGKERSEHDQKSDREQRTWNNTYCGSARSNSYGTGFAGGLQLFQYGNL
jgi:hypothetical protein